MQYASSIKYGGLLVAANDCDYEAYKNLGLVCPCCHESVFLTAGHERYYNASNKKTTVVSHFSHRPDKDKKEVERCKLRIAQITSADITKNENVSRNQRLKLFNRHLWSLLNLCYKLNNFDESSIFINKGFNLIAENNTQAQAIFRAFNDLLTTIFLGEVPRIHRESEHYLEELIEKSQNEQFVPTESLQSLLATWRQTIDKKMHVAIYNEVVDCLVQKKHLPILQSLITLSLYNFVCVTAICERDRLSINKRITAYNSLHSQNVQINESVIYEVFSNLVDVFASRNSKAMEAIAAFVRDDVLEIIAFTPWAEGFEKFSS